MKLLVGAIALSLAVPSAAQTATPQTDQAAQSHHQHNRAAASASHADHSAHQMPHSTAHVGNVMKDCCVDKDGNGIMDCCESKAAKKEEQPPAEPKGD